MFRRIEISNFKRIANLSFETPQNLAVLLGGNDSGKSSALEAVHFALSAARTAGAQAPDAWIGDEEFSYELGAEHLSFSRLDWRSVFRADQPVEMTLEAHDERRCAINISRVGNYSLLVRLTGRLLGAQIQEPGRPFCVYVPGLAGIPLRERFQSEGAIRRAISRGDSNLVLRNVLYLLFRQETQWPDFVRDLQSLFPDSSIVLDFDPVRDEDVEVTQQLTPESPALPLASAGTGFLQCVQLLAYTHLFGPRVLLLDEPDAHLHPRNQRRLCNLIHRVGEDSGTQVVIATHSRHVTSALTGRATFHWLKAGVAVPEPGPSLISALMDLGALDDGEKLGGKDLRCLVLTEDSDPEMLKVVLWSSGFREDETIVVPYEGCTNFDSVQAFNAFIRHRLTGVSVVVHRDRDYLEAVEIAEFEVRMTKGGFLPFLTEGTSVESHFINPKYISKYFAVTEARAGELIAEATATTKVKSVEKMANSRYDLSMARYRKELKRDPKAKYPNGAQIMFGAAAEYDQNPANLRHGKIVFRALKALLQTETGKSVSELPGCTSTLCVPTLSVIAAGIWPPPLPLPSAQPPPPPPTAAPAAPTQIAGPPAVLQPAQPAAPVPEPGPDGAEDGAAKPTAGEGKA